MPIWEHLRHFVTGPQLPWVILWLGLATLITGLIVLTRTSWGQSHPLRKCAVLVAAGASAAGRLRDDRADRHRRFARRTFGQRRRSRSLWSTMPTRPAPAENRRLESTHRRRRADRSARRRAGPIRIGSDRRKPKTATARETIAAASKPLLDQSPADMVGRNQTAKPTRPIASATAPASPAHVETGRADRRRRSAASRVGGQRPARRALSPDRQPLAAPDGRSKPGDAAAALAGLPSLVPSTGPDVAFGPRFVRRHDPRADPLHGGTQGGHRRHPSATRALRAATSALSIRRGRSLAAGPAQAYASESRRAGDDGDSPGIADCNRLDRPLADRSSAAANLQRSHLERSPVGASSSRRFARNRSGRASGAQMARRCIKSPTDISTPRNTAPATKHRRLGHDRSGAGCKSRHRRHRPRAARHARQRQHASRRPLRSQRATWLGVSALGARRRRKSRRPRPRRFRSCIATAWPRSP